MEVRYDLDMSLCIAVVIPEGIVVAGESRQTQIVANVNRIGTDSATKVFGLTDTVLAATTGWAFLQPQGATAPRNVASLVEDYKPTIPAGASVQAIAALLWQHFNGIYTQHIAQLPGSAVTAGQTALNFIVAGYDPASRQGELFSIEIPSPTAPTATSRSTAQPGPWWIGQVDVVARLINGFDPRAVSLPFVQTAIQTNPAAPTEFVGLQYAVYYNTMTMQDAIDFAVGLIQITITIQRFTAGIATQLGSVAGVGGPIDVAVVQPGEDVRWISRKQLHV